MEKRSALGKGLSALIPDAPEPARATGSLEVDIDRLAPSDDQPRRHLDEARLDELAASIKANGVIQPIVVRRAGADYRIIAGERRWRAAQRAGLLKVPIVVRDVEGEDRQRILQMALIENIQREDLNPIEEAQAYRRLVDEFSLTQDAVSGAVGKDRSTVANMLRLLRLPGDVQNDVASGAISMGHARALIALPDAAAQRALAQDVVARSLSVRETEALVRRALEGAPAASPRAQAAAPQPDVHTRAAEDKLKLQLGTRVKIVRRGKGGRIEIAFTSEDELIRVYELLTDGRA